MAMLKDKGVKIIVCGWLGFIAENIVVSHNREYIIQHLGGEKTYRYLYSFCSTVGTSCILYGYLKHSRNKGPTIWKLFSKSQKIAALSLQCIGLAGFSQTLPGLQIPIDKDNNWEVRCPFDFKTYKNQDDIYGIKRITRHDNLWSLAVLGLGTAFGTPFLGEFFMFSMPLLFAIIGGAHQDYRYRRGMGGNLPIEIDNVTSNIPFIAFISGQQNWNKLSDEIKWNNIAIACIFGYLLQFRRIKRLKRLGFF